MGNKRVQAPEGYASLEEYINKELWDNLTFKEIAERLDCTSSTVARKTHEAQLDVKSIRFWNRVRPGNGDGCWTWAGRHAEAGYGQFGHNTLVHRHIFETVNGPITKGACVLHKCDNPGCCNPDHLYLGTPQDNARDRVERGRQGKRFTTSEVKLILERAASGDSPLAIARFLSIDPRRVRKICARRTYKKVTHESVI